MRSSTSKSSAQGSASQEVGGDAGVAVRGFDGGSVVDDEVDVHVEKVQGLVAPHVAGSVAKNRPNSSQPVMMGSPGACLIASTRCGGLQMSVCDERGS
jgi:hypothetical protein